MARLTEAQNIKALTIVLMKIYGYRDDYARKLAAWSDAVAGTAADTAINPKPADLDALETAQALVHELHAVLSPTP